MKPCRETDCAKPAGVPGTAHGWCSTHYTRWKRHGDPNYTPPAPETHCIVQDCPTPRWARGLCATHYQRLRKTGEVGGAERMWKPAKGRCSVVKCRRAVESKGLCSPHYQRLRRHGSATAGATPMFQRQACDILGCDRRFYALGMCQLHWAAIQRSAIRLDKLGLPVVGDCTPKQLIDRISLFANRCWMCGGVADGVDHVKPLSAGGSLWPANLRPACATCNTRKHATWPYGLTQARQPMEATA